jgi:hypothetical protein
MSLSTAPGAVPDRRVHAFLYAGWIAVMVVACIVSVQLHGQTSQLTSSEVKAGFLFNLAKFVEWPDAAFPSAREPMTFSIVGADPLGHALSRAVYGQSIKGRTVTVRKYNFGDDLRSCQVLFVSASEQARLTEILSSVLGASILTVSDARRFAEAGGIVPMAVEEDRVHLSVNHDAAAVAKLQIGAQLLTLSHIIHPPGALGTK